MVVVLVFVISNYLAMLCNIFELFNVDAVNVIFVSNFLVTLNHSVNLFIYYTFGGRFRGELKRMAIQTKRKIGKYAGVRMKINLKAIPLISLSYTIGNKEWENQWAFPVILREICFEKHQRQIWKMNSILIICWILIMISLIICFKNPNYLNLTHLYRFKIVYEVVYMYCENI